MAYTNSRQKRRKYKKKKILRRRILILLTLLFCYLNFFTGISLDDIPGIAKGEYTVNALAQELLPRDEYKIVKTIWELYDEVRSNGIKHLPEKFFPSSPARSVSYDPPISLEEIPPYSGNAYVSINGSVPTFTQEEMSDYSCNYFAPLDSLGRCGRTQVMLSPKTMPTEARGEIGMVKPSGWHTVKYQGIDGNYLYNRCHLIGFQLSGENANEKNLITGTRYLNIVGMLPFENAVADYIRATGNHVLYRVTPIFEGNNLVANGVQMEGRSIEDDGYGIYFNVFCYNVQPGVTIDYATGDSSGPRYG